MLQLFIIALVVSTVLGGPQDPNKDKDAKVLFSEDERDDQISYLYKFDTSNGISRAEIGEFEEESLETGIAVIKGYYSYVGPDNVRYTVTYVADENGYRPKIHRSDKNQLPQEALESDGSSIKIEGVDDDRIGSKLLISLSGGNIG